MDTRNAEGYAVTGDGTIHALPEPPAVVEHPPCSEREFLHEHLTVTAVQQLPGGLARVKASYMAGDVEPVAGDPSGYEASVHYVVALDAPAVQFMIGEKIVLRLERPELQRVDANTYRCS